MAKRRAGATADRSGQVWVRIESFTRKWFISRTDLGAAERVDDDAQLELVTTIEAITPAHKKHLGATMHISLLSAQVTPPQDPVGRHSLARRRCVARSARPSLICRHGRFGSGLA